MSDALQLILTIAVGFVLGVALLAAVLFLGARWFVQRKINRFAEKMKEGAEGSKLFETIAQSMAPPPIPTPPRVHLQKRESAPWREEGEIERLVAPLRERGFVPIGDYTMHEMPGVVLRALREPAGRFYALAYEHGPAQVVVLDLHARLQESNQESDALDAPAGGTITVTNAPTGHQLEPNPSHRKVYLPGTPVPEMLRRMEGELANVSTTPATPEAFVAEFEGSYAESMDWVLSRGASQEAMRRIARDIGITDEEAILKSYQERQAHNAVLLEEVVRRKFLESGQISASRWDDVRGRVIVIHDGHSTEHVLEEVFLPLLWRGYGVPDGNYGLDPFEEHPPGVAEEAEAREAQARRVAQELEPRQAFAQLVETLPPERRPALLGSVDAPVRADLYEAPAD